MAYGGLLFAGGGMYGQMPAYLNRGPRSLCSRQTISQKSAVSYRPVPASTTWAEAAAEARYLILLFAETSEARNPRRQELIAKVLDDLARLSD